MCCTSMYELFVHLFMQNCAKVMFDGYAWKINSNFVVNLYFTLVLTTQGMEIRNVWFLQMELLKENQRFSMIHPSSSMVKFRMDNPEIWVQYTSSKLKMHITNCPLIYVQAYENYSCVKILRYLREQVCNAIHMTNSTTYMALCCMM